MPWAYVRRELARVWNVPPWEVDEAPVDEVLTELRIAAIESEVERSRPKPRAKGR